MKKTTVTKAKFETPGILSPESYYSEVESRDIDQLYIPSNTYAISFYDVTTIEGDDGEVYGGQPKNQSPRYLVGKRFTVEEIEQTVPDCRILARNMRSNYPGALAVLCPTGNWQPLRPDKDVWYGETW